MDQNMEQIVAALKPFFDRIDARFDQVDARFAAIDQRLDRMDQRFDAIERQLDDHDQQFISINKRFDHLDHTLAVMVEHIDARFDAVERDAAVTKTILGRVADDVTAMKEDVAELNSRTGLHAQLLLEHERLLRRRKPRLS